MDTSSPTRMRLSRLWRSLFVTALLAGVVIVGCAQDADWHDPSPHRVLSVLVAPDVNLEVLDWGGTGRPVVLLAGLGNTAHIFDDFAPKLAQTHHVYGITRRGYGASSAPPAGYTSDRLAEDVLAALGSLKIQSPIIVGHSIAGEEMTILGRHPTRVAGLVYLDAAYDRSSESFAKWNELSTKARPPPPGQEDLASYSALRAWYARTSGTAPTESDLRANSLWAPLSPIGVPRTGQEIPKAILAGISKPDYGAVRVPALAIYAVPRTEENVLGFGSVPPSVIHDIFQLSREQVRANSSAFRAGVRDARVIEIPGAKHNVFQSNEAEVLRDILEFSAVAGQTTAPSR